MKTMYQIDIEKMMEAQTDKGLHKYGVVLEDNVTLSSIQRIEHIQEEAIDALFYCQHLKTLLEGDGLTANDYQRASLRTAQVDTFGPEELLLNGVMGLNGEAGECIDIVKKARFQGHELNKEDLVEELGDVLWYASLIAYALGVDLSEVMQKNIDKLKRRYPERFDKDKSIHREV